MGATMHSLDCEECKTLFRFKGEWCHVGGVTNFAKIGHAVEEGNYGWPHVVLAGTTNCCFCGREIDL